MTMYKQVKQDVLDTVFHEIATELSFFNAGEGDSYKSETKSRYACQAIYKEICQEYKDRGLNIPKGNHLI